MNFRASLLLVTVGLILIVSPQHLATSFQAREHLTPKEVDLVKEAQILDQRVAVFIKAADRRVLALNVGTSASAKQLKKDSDSWGDLPTGTRAELVGDIVRILDEAITNIEDVSSRDEKNPLIPEAIRSLAAAATRIVEQLKPLQLQTKDDSEASSFDQLVENVDSITQAANKLPPPIDTKKSKTGKSKDTN